MTPADHDMRWGIDPKRFDGYLLREAEAAVRVLVPAQVDGTETHVPWAEVATDYRRELPLNGYTSWSDVTELPGDGSFAPDRIYHPAAGFLPEQFCVLLLQALPHPNREQRWHAERHQVLMFRQVGLTPPSLATAGVTTWDDSVASRGGQGPAAAPPPGSPATVTGTLAELMATWSKDGFPGWAWSSDGRIGIAAPPYADSLVVSGPADLVLPLATSGLDAFPVSRHHPLPQMTS